LITAAPAAAARRGAGLPLRLDGVTLAISLPSACAAFVWTRRRQLQRDADERPLDPYRARCVRRADVRLRISGRAPGARHPARPGDPLGAVEQANGLPRIALRKLEAAQALGISDESFDRYVKPFVRVVRWNSLRLYPHPKSQSSSAGDRALAPAPKITAPLPRRRR